MRFITIWIFEFFFHKWVCEFGHNLSLLNFVTIWVFEFSQVSSFWVWSQFEFLWFHNWSFNFVKILVVTVWVFKIYHNLRFGILSKLKFSHNLSIWDSSQFEFESGHNLSFWVLSQFEILRFVIFWVFEICPILVTIWVFEFYYKLSFTVPRGKTGVITNLV